MTFIQICNENALNISYTRTGDIQHAARDLKPTVINLITLSRACQDETNVREHFIHMNIIYL